MTDEHELTWIIKQKQINKFKKLEQFEYIIGPQIHVDSLLFYLILYPKGNKDYYTQKYVHLYIGVDGPKDDISGITLESTFKIKELSREFDDETWNIPLTAVKFEDIQHLKRLSINVLFSIDYALRYGRTTELPKLNVVKYYDEYKNSDDSDADTLDDISNENTRYIVSDKPLYMLHDNKPNSKVFEFTWEIKGDLLDKYYMCQFKEWIYHEPIYFGDIWFGIEIYPKGDDGAETWGSIDITCNFSESKVKELDIEYIVEVREIGSHWSNSCRFIKDNNEFVSMFGNINDFADIDGLTVDVRIAVCDIMSNNGEIIPKQLWDKYIWNDDVKADNEYIEYKTIEWTLKRQDNESFNDIIGEFKESNDVYIGDIKFNVEIYPKSFDYDDKIGVYIHYEWDIDKMDAHDFDLRYTIQVNGEIITKCYDNIDDDDGYFGGELSNKIFDISNEINIIAKFKISDVWDVDSNLISRNLWNKYLKHNKEKGFINALNAYLESNQPKNIKNENIKTETVKPRDNVSSTDMNDIKTTKSSWNFYIMKIFIILTVIFIPTLIDYYFFVFLV